MRPEDLPDMMPDAAPDAALVERIGAALAADARPVQPVAAAGDTVSGLLVVFLAMASLGATILGFYGVLRLPAWDIALVLSPLAGLALLAAAASANAMRPGSRRRFHPWVLMAAGIALMGTIFAFLLQDHTLGQFVPQGLTCLKAGLSWALPTAIFAWILLRRGYPVDRRAAGVAQGTFAGLAGLAVLELHCPNFRMWHVVVWHLAVVPVSALAGWVAYSFGSSGSKRRAAELMQ
jgi:hypothetical protein